MEPESLRVVGPVLLGRLQADQALVAQRLEAAEQVDVACVLGVDDGLHSLEREAATEYAECAEQAAFVVVQQVVAPGDRAPQGPLPLRRIARARRQVEAVTELLEDLRRASSGGCEPPRARWPAASRRAAR